MGKPQQQSLKFPTNLSRFRNDIVEFSHKFGGVPTKKKVFKGDLSRKEKRKMERKLKQAKCVAYSKKEKMPTLDTLMDATLKKKKIKKKKKKSKKAKTEKKDDEEANDEVEPPMKLPTSNVIHSLDIIEKKNIKENKNKKNYEKSTQNSYKRKLQEDNEREEKEISRLEKKLRIKKGSKNYKQSFVDDGLDALLDFCDETKRKDMIENDGSNAWIGGPEDLELSLAPEMETELTNKKEKKRARIEMLNKSLKNEESDLGSGEDTPEENGGDFFKKNGDTRKDGKRKVHFDAGKGEEGESSNEDQDEDEFSDEEDDEDDLSGDDEDDGDAENYTDEEDEENSLEGEEDDDEDIQNSSEGEEDEFESEKLKKGVKEDIYGRLIDKAGQVVKSEKYIPPAQRLKLLLEQSTPESTIKLAKLNKQIKGLFNRLSTANMHSICNQIIQMFYSNQFTRHELMETMHTLLVTSIVVSNCLTPFRMVVEHAALVSILSANIGVELGANLLQKFCLMLNEELTSEGDGSYAVENKTLDNILLFVCNLYNFKLFSSNLLFDLLNELIDGLKLDSARLEKQVDLILHILKCVGFSMRKDNPVVLKDVIVKLQTKINSIKAAQDVTKSNNDESVNGRLKFIIDSVTAIKNNDVRRLDGYDSEIIDVIKRQTKTLLKEEKDHSQLNINFKDLVNANEQGRWWIVGSAWSNKGGEEDENDGSDKILNSQTKSGGAYSEKILQLARDQHMNTDVRKSIFCIVVSAEDYTDAYMKLVKLSLKKQQEREIIYVIVHCALNEKRHNPYYFYLLQKFCEYDRRFKMTLQFHTWDKFKLLNEMNTQQISNFAAAYVHLILCGSMTLSVLKNIEFGEMDKSLLQFLRELIVGLFAKCSDEQLQQQFIRIGSANKLHQLRNALRLFISHFLLTNKGKEIEIDEKLKLKCEMAQKCLNTNFNE